MRIIGLFFIVLSIFIGMAIVLNALETFAQNHPPLAIGIYVGIYILLFLVFNRDKIKQYFRNKKEKYFFQIKQQISLAKNPEELFKCVEDFYESYQFQRNISMFDKLHYTQIEQLFNNKLRSFEKKEIFSIEDKVEEFLLKFSFSQNELLLNKGLIYTKNKIIENIFIIPFLWLVGGIIVLIIFGLIFAEGLKFSGMFLYIAGLMVIIFSINRIFAFFRIKIISRMLFLNFSFFEFQKHTISYFNSQNFLREKNAQNLILFSKIAHYLMKNISERKQKVQILSIFGFMFFHSGEMQKFLVDSKNKLAKDALWSKNIIQRWAKMQLQDQKHVDEVRKNMHSEYVELYLRRRESYERSLNSLL